MIGDHRGIQRQCRHIGTTIRTRNVRKRSSPGMKHAMPLDHQLHRSAIEIRFRRRWGCRSLAAGHQYRRRITTDVDWRDHCQCGNVGKLGERLDLLTRQSRCPDQRRWGVHHRSTQPDPLTAGWICDLSPPTLRPKICLALPRSSLSNWKGTAGCLLRYPVLVARRASLGDDSPYALPPTGGYSRTCVAKARGFTSAAASRARDYRC